jgi:hypothetical protein
MTSIFRALFDGKNNFLWWTTTNVVTACNSKVILEKIELQKVYTLLEIGRISIFTSMKQAESGTLLVAAPN